MADDLEADQTVESLDASDDDVDDEFVDDDDVEFVDDDDVDDEFHAAGDGDEDDETEESLPEKQVKTVKATATKSAREIEEEEQEEDEEEDPDDVEADLDAILKDRLVVADDDDQEDEVAEVEEKAEGGKIRPRRPGEFVCQSCFLVKHPSQLAEGQVLLCRDCV
jgi:hypothetical protein